MRAYLLILIIFGICTSNFTIQAQITNTAQLLDAMQSRYRGNWFETFTFEQQTIRFQENGAVRDTAIWNEAIHYPDQFRIDYGEAGRFVVYRSDSAYRFTNFELQSARFEPQEFLLFKGGMYFMPANKVLEKLEEYGYNTALFREDRLHGQRVYVIGAEKSDLATKQFWVNADHYYTVRRISLAGQGRTLDVQYSDHKKFADGWVEQTVFFYLNGRLIQKELYLDIEVDVQLSQDIFNQNKPALNWWR